MKVKSLRKSPTRKSKKSSCRSVSRSTGRCRKSLSRKKLSANATKELDENPGDLPSEEGKAWYPKV